MRMKGFMTFTVIVFLLSCTSFSSGSAIEFDPLDSWKTRNHSFSDEYLAGVAYCLQSEYFRGCKIFRHYSNICRWRNMDS